MFNSHLFNVRTFNGNFVNNTVYSTDRLVFEGFSLSDGSVMVMTEFPDSGPSREIVGGSVPRGDGEFITADYFRSRPIEAAGIVKKDTADELDAFLDTIRKNLRTREGNLDVIDSNGTVKRYIATLANYEQLFSERKRYHITVCPWRVRFVCKTPFGRSRSYSSRSFSLSTSPTTQAVVNSGTIETFPVVTLIFSAASGITAVNVKNNTNGDEIEYGDSVSAGDVLVFDSERKEVTKNGTAVDFTGAFPQLDVGSNLVQFTITGTSFTAYATVKWKPQYL